MRSKTFKIAYGGICLALAEVFLFAATVVPGVELTLFAISSLFTALMILETGVGGGILLYVGAALLGFAIIPNKLALIPYVFLFGYYAVLKFYIEKIKSGVLQLTLKVIYFAALMCLGLLLFKSVLASAVTIPDFPVAVLIVAGTLLMILYDYVMTFLIDWYLRRIRHKDEGQFKLS